eukprot:Nk52_evm5s283 gene=Nk52_evmTU5s283
MDCYQTYRRTSNSAPPSAEIQAQLPQREMTFGKHKGLPVWEIPSGYLNWMLNNNVLRDKPDLRRSLELCDKITPSSSSSSTNNNRNTATIISDHRVVDDSSDDNYDYDNCEFYYEYAYEHPDEHSDRRWLDEMAIIDHHCRMWDEYEASKPYAKIDRTGVFNMKEGFIPRDTTNAPSANLNNALETNAHPQKAAWAASYGSNEEGLSHLIDVMQEFLSLRDLCALVSTCQRVKNTCEAIINRRLRALKLNVFVLTEGEIYCSSINHSTARENVINVNFDSKLGYYSEYDISYTVFYSKNLIRLHCQGEADECDTGTMLNFSSDETVLCDTSGWNTGPQSSKDAARPQEEWGSEEEEEEEWDEEKERGFQYEHDPHIKITIAPESSSDTKNCPDVPTLGYFDEHSFEMGFDDIDNADLKTLREHRLLLVPEWSAVVGKYGDNVLKSEKRLGEWELKVHLEKVEGGGGRRNTRGKLIVDSFKVAKRDLLLCLSGKWYLQKNKS